MKTDLNKGSGKFMLHLTDQERKKLKLIAVAQNTTMQSLIKYLLHNQKSIQDL